MIYLQSLDLKHVQTTRRANFHEFHQNFISGLTMIMIIIPALFVGRLVLFRRRLLTCIYLPLPHYNYSNGFNQRIRPLPSQLL